jgi:hypothetical protein
MLPRWTRSLRGKAALALAALYVLSILLPSVAFAWSGVPAHCLTEAGHAHVHRSGDQPKAHVHGDGTVHTHGSKAAPHKDAEDVALPDYANGDGNKRDSNCCGLFCITGLSLEAPAIASTPVVGSHSVAALAGVLTGRGPDRINRPPIR